MIMKFIGTTSVVIGMVLLVGCSGGTKIQGNWGYIDRTGKVVIPAQFAEGRDFADGVAAVKIGGS